MFADRRVANKKPIFNEQIQERRNQDRNSERMNLYISDELWYLKVNYVKSQAKQVKPNIHPRGV